MENKKQIIFKSVLIALVATILVTGLFVLLQPLHKAIGTGFMVGFGVMLFQVKRISDKVKNGEEYYEED